MFSQAEKGKGIQECGQRPEYVCRMLKHLEVVWGNGKTKGVVGGQCARGEGRG